MSRISIQSAIILVALMAAAYPILKQMYKFVDWLWKAGGKFITRVRDYTHANEIQNPFAKPDDD